MVNWFSTRLPKPFNEERTIFSTNSAETTGYLHAKRKKKKERKERKKEKKNLEPYHAS